MNIDPNIVIPTGTLIVAVLVMIKSNNQMLKGQDKNFADMAKKMSEDRQEGKENLNSVHTQVTRDIDFVRDSLAGTKDQLSGELFPRMNAAEKFCEKNCRALIDHQKFCDERHRNLTPKGVQQ